MWDLYVNGFLLRSEMCNSRCVVSEVGLKSRCRTQFTLEVWKVARFCCLHSQHYAWYWLWCCKGVWIDGKKPNQNRTYYPRDEPQYQFDEEKMSTMCIAECPAVNKYITTCERMRECFLDTTGTNSMLQGSVRVLCTHLPGETKSKAKFKVETSSQSEGRRLSLNEGPSFQASNKLGTSYAIDMYDILVVTSCFARR